MDTNGLDNTQPSHVPREPRPHRRLAGRQPRPPHAAGGAERRAVGCLDAGTAARHVGGSTRLSVDDGSDARDWLIVPGDAAVQQQAQPVVELLSTDARLPQAQPVPGFFAADRGIGKRSLPSVEPGAPRRPAGSRKAGSERPSAMAASLSAADRPGSDCRTDRSLNLSPMVVLLLHER